MGLILLKIKYHVVAFFIFLKYKILFGSSFSVGKGTTCRKFFNVYIENGAKISIGKDCFFNNGCSLTALEEIRIGDGVLFGENVKIYDHNHIYKDSNAPIKNQGYTTAPIKIGNHCWIGSNVTILKGISIGNNVVVGANCLIYQDIPDNSVVMSREKLIFKMRHKEGVQSEQ